MNSKLFDIGNTHIDQISGCMSLMRMNSITSDPIFLQRNNTSSMSSLHLEEIIERDSAEKNYSEPHHVQHSISPQSFQSLNPHTLNSKDGTNLRLCLTSRKLDIFAYCYQIEMLFPYYQDTMRFCLLQIDP